MTKQLTLKNLSNGFGIALEGVSGCCKNPNFRALYGNFLSTFGSVIVSLYSAFGLGILVLLPIFVGMLIWIPSLVSLFIIWMPAWVQIVGKEYAPVTAEQLFLCEMRRINPQLASDIEEKISKRIHANMATNLWHKIRSGSHFGKKSVLFATFAAIPLLGWFAVLPQILLAAESLAWNLLSIYTVTYRGMSYKHQQRWMDEHKGVIVGFAAPMVLLTSIPVAGPFLLGVAQGASAHLVQKLIQVEGTPQADMSTKATQ